MSRVLRPVVRALAMMAAVAGLVALASAPAVASGLRVSDVKLQPASSGSREVTATIAWRHGWRNARNHDAAWVFVKVKLANGAWRHARVAQAGHRIDAGSPRGSVVVPDDRVGVFAVPMDEHRGDVAWTMTIGLDAVSEEPVDVAVFALEMVEIPAGPFTLGDPDPRAVREFAAVYKSNAAGEPDGLFHIASEDPIVVAPSAGALFYKTRTPQYEGDRVGPVPAAFPKGTRAFYVMKYEMSQGDYASFLNTLHGQATYFRAIHGGRGYADGRGTIRMEGSAYVAGAPGRPANWVSWGDSMAFSDWAGLRPMTEFEFTKAARGPGAPMPHEYPWGSASAERLKRVMRPDDELETSGDADEARLDDSTREVLGASFYWVMDLAGSVWERVISFGHPAGRAFQGTHGDGALSPYGDATNDDWPRGDQDTGGYGYRGGGYYERGMKPGDLNPYSPIAYRRYGSWGGGPRSIAYGYRAARISPL